MKRFLCVSIGTLCLSLSALVGFHIGSRSAHAQASKTSEGGLAVQGDQLFMSNAAGDVWVRSLDSDGYPGAFKGAPRYIGNVFTIKK